MATWHYPGPRRRQQGKRQCAEPRWSKPEYMSLAWATQSLVALDLFLAICIRMPGIGSMCWWLVLILTAVAFVLVSILAVR